MESTMYVGLALLLVLLCTDQCTSSVNNTSLRKVKRVDNSSYTDHYFSCNVVGRFLIWLYNDITIRVFFPSDVGKAIVSSRSGVQFTTTLLASRIHESDISLTELDSILVVSLEDVDLPFVITCNNEVESRVADSTTLIDGAIDSNKIEGIVFDHILSTTIVRSRSDTHVFVCGSNSDLQFLEIAGPAIGFSQSDMVGQVRTVLSSDRSTVNVQGILIAQDPFNKITLLLVPKNGMVSVRCFYDSEHQVVLPSPSTTEVSVTRELSSEPPAYSSDSGPSEASNDSAAVPTTIILIVVLLGIFFLAVAMLMMFILVIYFRRSRKFKLVVHVLPEVKTTSSDIAQLDLENGNEIKVEPVQENLDKKMLNNQRPVQEEQGKVEADSRKLESTMVCQGACHDAVKLVRPAISFDTEIAGHSIEDTGDEIQNDLESWPLQVENGGNQAAELIVSGKLSKEVFIACDEGTLVREEFTTSSTSIHLVSSSNGELRQRIVQEKSVPPRRFFPVCRGVPGPPYS